MLQSQLDVLNRLDEVTTGLLAHMQSSLPNLNKELLSIVNDFITSLDKTIIGRVKATVDNLKKVNGFRKQLDKAFVQGEYIDSVKVFLQGFDMAAGLINEYFVSVVKEFQASKTVYQAIRQANIDTTVSSMLGSGLDANLKDPVIKLLRQNVAGATDSKALRELVKNEIIGTPTTSPLLTRYVNQVTNDSLYQYESNYLQAVSNDLELEYAFYQGTVISDSRSFCVARAGKYFTMEEVRSWGSLHWAGQAKGTNSSNIITLRGGYFCKHLIIPVSQAMYERQIAKQKK